MAIQGFTPELDEETKPTSGAPVSDDPDLYPDNTTPPEMAAERSRLIEQGALRPGAVVPEQVEPSLDDTSFQIPTSESMVFERGQGSASDRIRALEDYLDRVSPSLEVMGLSFSNMQKAERSKHELLTYTCLGEVPDGKGGVLRCGMQQKAKRPEFRTYEERIICPNPAHRGELTPMEPVL